MINNDYVFYFAIKFLFYQIILKYYLIYKKILKIFYKEKKLYFIKINILRKDDNMECKISNI